MTATTDRSPEPQSLAAEHLPAASAAESVHAASAAEYVHAASAAEHLPAASAYATVRAASLALTAGLSAEDMLAQSMPDASPVKWHLAHTSWFFETFVLAELPAYRAFDPAYAILFNSYYNSVGAQHARPQRGLLTRPALAEVLRYREHVDHSMQAALAAGLSAELITRTTLGLHHEQQHQELILTDLQHLLFQNPLQPIFRPVPKDISVQSVLRDTWHTHPGGIVELGHHSRGFAFDNEGPRHRVFLEAFEIADRLVTCGEYLTFIEDGGYRRPELWLSDGWAAVQAEGWTAPLYWSDGEEGRRVFSLHGERPLDPAEPVCHLSHYEADAFARWAGARLPTEAEWETAAASAETPKDGGGLHPTPDAGGEGLRQLTGQLWQWTASAYLPYPRFRPAPGAVGEYNGKFMSGQVVLRGSAAVTSPSHTRITYRNFFPPQARWAFSGVRLARDA